MKIEYDLYENFTFFILITCIIFCKLWLLWLYSIEEWSMFNFFFQVFYMHINFRINILLTYLSCIVFWILKNSRISFKKNIHVSAYSYCIVHALTHLYFSLHRCWIGIATHVIVYSLSKKKCDCILYLFSK